MSAICSVFPKSLSQVQHRLRTQRGQFLYFSFMPLPNGCERWLRTNGRIVPAILATSQFAIKGKKKGRRELALFLGGDIPCRKVRFFHQSSCPRNSQRPKTRQASEIRFCTSSNRSVHEPPFPRASTTASRCAFRISLTTMPRDSMKPGSHRMPTDYASCATRSPGLAGAIRSTPFAMSSAPSSKRYGSATISHVTSCEPPRPYAPLKWRPSSGLRRSIDRFQIKRRLRIWDDRFHQHPHRKSQSTGCRCKPASSNQNTDST